MGHFKYSYIDKTGKVVIDVGKYDGAGGFSGGLATVYLEDKGCGFIDKTGKEIIEPQFEGATCFSEGLAGVHIKDKWGFIDNAGRLPSPERRLAIPPGRRAARRR